LGQRLTLAGKPRTIVGVMPREFAFPSPETRLWLAERIRSAFLSARDPGPRGETRGLTIGLYNAVARLKPAVTPEQAASEALARTKAVSPILENGGFAAFANPKVAVVPMLEWLVKDVKPALWMLLTAGVLLFAAAIGNVANMQLVRASSRQREIAIRAAIGAGSGRLVRQLFVETSLIAAIGSAIGLGLTSALLRVLPAALPEDFPRAEDIAIDTRVLMVVTSLAIVVSVVIALLPSRMARRVKLTSALAEDGSAPVGQSLRSPAARARALIITGQVAVAAVLLVGAALLAQSFANQIRVDRGYQPASLLTARLTLIGRGLPAGARPIFFNEVLDRLAATHGVTHAALTSHLPLTPSELPAQIFDGAPKPQGYPPFDRRRMDAMLRIVSPDYFAAMGIRVLRGRGFTNQDVVSSEPVMVVNEAFAKKYFGGQPLDALLFPGDIVNNGDHQIWKVVGVVSDVVHRGATEPIQPEVFATFNQQRGGPYGSQFLTVRTAGDPAALSRELRTIVRGASPNGVLEQVMTMDARVMRSLSRPRLYAALLGGFGSFALLIAAIGLFGGLAYGVTQRTREIGVRTALGATPRDIVELVLRQGLVMTVCGIAIGFGIAASTGRYLSGFLFGVTPANPATFGVVGVALVLVAGIACAIPARRAAKIDAIQALKR
jgi:putative ABC transport system permease protein